MSKIFIVIVLFAPALAMAEIGSNPNSVFEATTENNVFIGVRAAGMGGAQIAAAEDGSALWYNPALLTRVRRIELSGALSHQRFFNETTFDLPVPVSTNSRQVNNTRLASLWAVFPIPTDRGALSLAFSANRVKNFDRIFRYESQTSWWENHSGDGFGGGEDDIGGLWAYSFGGGIEVSRKASVGLSLDIFDGSDNYAQLEDSIAGAAEFSYRSNLEDNYSGYSGKLGLAFSAGPYLHLGSVVRFPAIITVEQNFDERTDINGHVESDFSTGRYRYLMPFSFGAGAAFFYRQLLVTADLNYTDFTQLEYKSGLDFATANEDVKRYYRDVASISLGAEYSIPDWGLSLRAGYNHDPIPFKYHATSKEPNTFTGGVSYLIDRTLKLDLAVNFSKWTAQDPNFKEGAGTIEKYRAQRFYLGVSYRY
jgi:long-subunit fatty acid transport protein